MKIILLRHAEAQRGSGAKALEDYGLTELGKHQAAEVARALSNLDIDRIVTSPLPRAVETSQIISDHLHFPTPNRLDKLAEIGEINSEEESLPAFFDRVSSTMNQIASEQDYTVTLAVTHAGFIMGSIRALFGIPTPGTGARLEPEFTSLTAWHKEKHHWALSYFNLPGANAEIL